MVCTAAPPTPTSRSVPSAVILGLPSAPWSPPHCTVASPPGAPRHVAAARVLVGRTRPAALQVGTTEQRR
nr:hypothetical protein [Deltaproteobacteria bacterium]